METNAQTQKFCKHCGAQIHPEAVICPNCGRQVEEIKQTETQSPNIVINNANTNTNVNKNTIGVVAGKPRNKWVALCLCIFLGFFGAHKFYDGKTGMGILYICTGGLFMIGVIIDIFAILSRPNPYYV